MKIIKFEQPNCQPCKMVSQFLENNGINYEKVDAFNDPDIASQYGIMTVPVVIMIDENDNEVMRSVGFKPNELKVLVEKITS